MNLVNYYLLQMDTRDLRAALRIAEADLAAARAQAVALSSQTADSQDRREQDLRVVSLNIIATVIS